MSQIAKAYSGAQIHDGHKLYDNHTFIIHRDGRRTIQSEPINGPVEQLNGGLITPGFVDLQVNGGGGIMFNDDQSVETLHKIAAAHAKSGTVAILPTLITDTPKRTQAAINAVNQAITEKVSGIIGLHLEGPHISVARKGAHDAQLIRKMEDDDLKIILAAAEKIPNIMVTIAPENTTNAQIRTMSDAGVIVSLGHTNTDFETCMAAFDAGATCVTHLFNAMQQFSSREPGLVGAALLRDDIYAGLIADGIHVHPASIQTALAARGNNERIFLVSDAMATAGTDMNSFSLNNRMITRHNGRLTLQNGTLAGADLTMAQAMSVMVNDAYDDKVAAIKRATTIPNSLLRDQQNLRLDASSSQVIYMKDNLSDPNFLT